MSTRQVLTLVITLLLLLLLGVAFWGFKNRNNAKELTLANAELNKRIGDLNDLRAKLEKQVDSLEIAYSELARENEDLKGSVATANAKIAEQATIIKKLRTQSNAETANLKTQIEQLLKAKAMLEASINVLQTENDSLKALTGRLTADLASARSENEALAALNRTIQDELKRLTLANFKATAFRVEVERRKPKATAKAGRARRILVSFDLTDVAPEYKGLRPIYLVITDDKGTPIKESTPIQAKVNVNGQDMDIIAVQKKEINVVTSQRLSFSHELEDKLRPGFYRVAVYTDVGLLGAASFRLQ